MRPDGRRRGRHQGSEDHWDAMRVCSSRPFCPCDGQRVSLWYLSAGCRYTAWSLIILDGYSRTMLAGAVAPSEASWVALTVL